MLEPVQLPSEYGMLSKLFALFNSFHLIHEVMLSPLQHASVLSTTEAWPGGGEGVGAVGGAAG